MKNTVFTVIAILLLLATAQFAAGDFTVHNSGDGEVKVAYAYWDETYSRDGKEGAWRVDAWHIVEGGSSELLPVPSSVDKVYIHIRDTNTNKNEVVESGSIGKDFTTYGLISDAWTLFLDPPSDRRPVQDFFFFGFKESGKNILPGSSREGRFYVTFFFSEHANGGSLTVGTQNPWEFQRSFNPHASSAPVRDIGFRGNSQIFFGRLQVLFKWDISARRFWSIDHYNIPDELQGNDIERRVAHVEVSEAHDIVAYTFGKGLYLRRTSDLSQIDSAGLPGGWRQYPIGLSMGPRTNYVIVSGVAGAGERYTQTYDLWENDSWGLNRRRLNAAAENTRLRHVDILNYDYAYGVGEDGQSFKELFYRQNQQFDPWTGLDFNPPGANSLVAVAAGETSYGDVRIAGITEDHELHVWDWHANHQSSSQHGTSQYPPRSFQFTPNREILTWINISISDPSKIVFWDVDPTPRDISPAGKRIQATVVKELTVPGIPTCHAFSQDGKTMAVGMTDGSVRLYKWTGGIAPSAPAKETERSQPTALLSNYPNPFNPETWIPYQLSEAAEVTVTIHSLDGKRVRTLELGQVPAGVYSDKGRAAYWDGRNAQGEPVASGVYFYTLSAGDFKATRKMVIRK